MINFVVISGNLTRDPELRYTPSGQAVLELNVAVNRKYKVNDEMKEEVSFFSAIVFGKFAEICKENLTKGSSVVVSGRLKQETWETEGKKQSKTKIIAEQVVFGQRKEKTEETIE